MKGYIYAAYETKTKREACLGVWDSIRDLARAMEINEKAAYGNLYRTRKNESTPRTDFSIWRFAMD